MKKTLSTAGLTWKSKHFEELLVHHLYMLKGSGLWLIVHWQNSDIFHVFSLRQTFHMNLTWRGLSPNIPFLFLMTRIWDDSGCRKVHFKANPSCCYSFRKNLSAIFDVILIWLAVLNQRGSLIWLDSTKGEIWEPKPSKCLYVGVFWSPLSTHIGKPLTVDVLLYMSSAVCRLLNYSFFFFFFLFSQML